MPARLTLAVEAGATGWKFDLVDRTLLRRRNESRRLFLSSRVRRLAQPSPAAASWRASILSGIVDTASNGWGGNGFFVFESLLDKGFGTKTTPKPCGVPRASKICKPPSPPMLFVWFWLNSFRWVNSNSLERSDVIRAGGCTKITPVACNWAGSGVACSGLTVILLLKHFRS